MGVAIKHDNQIIISTLNMVSREYPFSITKERVIESIYWSDCRDILNKCEDDEYPYFKMFDGELKDEYMDKYNSMLIER